MARPKNKQPIQRTHDIHIRCSEMEYEIVSGYAESAGLPTQHIYPKVYSQGSTSKHSYIVADTSEIHQLAHNRCWHRKQSESDYPLSAQWWKNHRQYRRRN